MEEAEKKEKTMIEVIQLSELKLPAKFTEFRDLDKILDHHPEQQVMIHEDAQEISSKSKWKQSTD